MTAMRIRAPLRIDFAGGWTDVMDFACRHTGAVVNAAITHYVFGERHASQDDFTIQYSTSTPEGSGLGMSGALNVVWLALARGELPHGESRKALAERAYRIEAVLGVKGGKQDQYAAALGGINLLRFVGEHTVAAALDIPVQTRVELSNRLVLAYCGRSRMSSAVHEEVWKAYHEGSTPVRYALVRMRDLAEKFADALKAGRFGIMADAINENWECQKMLSDAVMTPELARMFEIAASGGMLAGKACGAGGGGCAMFLCKKGKSTDVAGALESAGVRVLPVSFDMEGLMTW